MSEILKIYTAQQLYNMMRDKLIADGSGLTNFNVGSRIRSLLEAIALVESTTGFDYLEGLRRSIPVALYDGFGFKKKSATKSSGYLRFVRKPALTLNYTGAGSSASVSISGVTFSIAVIGAPGDNVSISLATYDTLDSLVTYLDGLPNYTAVLVLDGTLESIGLYAYSGKEIIGSKNYQNANGLDLMLSPADPITISTYTQVNVEDISFRTVVAGSIALGNAHSGAIQSESINTGIMTNILAGAIDTAVGKGVLASFISGVQYVVNDSAFSGGQDEETDVEQQRRFQMYVKGLSGSTVHGLESAVLSVVGVKSCSIKECYPKPGQNTIIADDGTGTLLPDMIAEINKVIDGDPDDFVTYPGARAAGITVNIQAPLVTTVNVDVTVYRVGTLSDEDEIKLAVQSAIEVYINTRQLGQDVVLSEMVALAKKSHPAIYDIEIILPTSNVSIDVTNVARTGAGTGATVDVTLVTYTVSP